MPNKKDGDKFKGGAYPPKHKRPDQVGSPESRRKVKREVRKLMERESRKANR